MKENLTLHVSHIERCLDYMNTKLTINLNSLVSKWFSVHKVRQTRRPCTYYPNSYATCQILLCGGDIAVNPGLCMMVKVKCQHCEKTIRRNQSKAVCAKYVLVKIAPNAPTLECKSLLISLVGYVLVVFSRSFLFIWKGI